MGDAWSYLLSWFSLPSLHLNPTWMVSVVVILVSLMVYDFLTASLRTSFPGVRGPRREFLSGNLKELIRRGSIHCHKEWMEKYGKAFTYSLARREYLCVTDPDLVRELIVTNFKNFQDRPLPPVRQRENLKALIFSQGSYWATARGAVMPVFHTEKLVHYAGIMNCCSRSLIEKLSAAADEKKSLNIAPLIQDMEIDVLGEAAFGIEFNVQQGKQSALARVLTEKARGSSKFRASVLISLYCGRTLGSLAESICRNLPWSEDAAVANKMRFLMNATSILAHARRVSPKGKQLNDLLTQLSRARTKDENQRTLADDEVAAVCSEFIAESDNVASTTAFAMYLVCAHPHVREKMVAEIDDFFANLDEKKDKVDDKPTFEDLDRFPYVDQVVNETLRLYPVAATLSRQAKERTTLGDLTIPKGKTVTVAIYAMHHNSELFPDCESFRPERFDPESKEAQNRHPYAYIPFGGGPRMCIGNKFARGETRLTLIKLFRKFRFELDESRSPKDPKDLKVETGIVLRAKNGVWVNVSLRKKN